MPNHPEDILQLQAHLLEKIAVGSELTVCLSELCTLVEGMVDQAICSTMLLDETGVLNVAAAPNVPQELRARLDGLVPCALAGSCGTAVYERRPVYVSDTSTDPRWEPMRDLAAEYEIRACWSFPIFSRSGDVLGSFAISHGVCREPSELHKSILRTASHLAGIAIDRHRQDEQLRASERKYLDLFENAPDMSASVDATTGRLITCNRTLARALGYEKEELLNKPVRELYQPSEELDRVCGVLAQTGVVESDDLKLLRRDGSTIDVSLKVTAVRDDDGQILLTRLVWRDVTERKRTEAAIQQAQKLESVGVLANGIAHDFNNLLVGLMGNAHLALDDLPENSDGCRAVRKIIEASQHAADLTKQLLTYSGRNRPAVEPLSLSSVVDEMVALLGSATKVAVDVVADDSALIRGDATQIRQVVMNLLTNAADAVNSTEGTLSVRTGVTHADRAYLESCITGHELPEGDYAFVDVEDNGCGMDQATVRKIFDPFFTTKSTGRGLGLAATLGIVKSHGGALRVETAPGRGTTFRLLCPAIEEREPAKPVTIPVKPASGATILAVDDEPAVLEVMEQMLRRAGYRVVAVPSGSRALEVAGSEQFDVAILDITMPGMSGPKTLTELRRLAPALPVVFCSGQSPSELDLNGDHENTGFLSKPFDPVSLTAAIEAALEQRPAVAGQKT